MISNKAVILTSNLTKEELIVGLKKIVKTRRAYPTDKYLFKGKVNKSGFKIQLLPYSLDNRMMFLDIVGVFQEMPNQETRIDVIAKLAIELKFIFSLGLILNLTVITFLYFNPPEKDPIFTWKLYALGLLFMIPLFYILFLHIKRKAIEQLKKTMKAKYVEAIVK
jgi:hypothetical protein